MRVSRLSRLWVCWPLLGLLVLAVGCPQSSVDSSAFRVKTASQEPSTSNSNTSEGAAAPAESASTGPVTQQTVTTPPPTPEQNQQVPSPVATPNPPVSENASSQPSPTPPSASHGTDQAAVNTESPPPASPPSPPATDLLALVDPATHCLMGQWTRVGRGFRSPAQAYTTLVFPFDPPSQFRLLIVARRIEGYESLNVTLPVGGSQAMVVLDGFGRRISGLSMVSGRTADANETRFFGFSFLPNMPVPIQFFCSPNRIAVQAGSRWIIDWRGSPGVLSLDSRFWKHIPPNRIAISVYSPNTVFVIERAELTPLPEGLGLPEETLVPGRPGSSLAGGPGSRPPFGPPWGRFDGPPESPAESPSVQESASPPASQTASEPPPSNVPVMHFHEEPPEAVTQWKDSVGLIEYPLGSGTGFVAKENLIATNAHVIEGAFAEDLEISFTGAQEGRYRVQKILFEDPARDLAILYVTCPQKPVTLAQNSELRTGDKVAIISNPSLGKTDIVVRNAIVAGQVAARVHTKGYDFYQVNANVNPGSSGAPLFNWQGEVVGVVAMKATEEGERELGMALRNLDQTFAKVMPGIIRRGAAFSIPGSSLVKAIEEAEKELQQPAGRAGDLHTERAMFEKLALAGALYLLKFAANVPDQVREQEQMVRLRGIPRMAASKVKLVDLMPEYQADKINEVLEGPEGREILAFCTNNVEQRLEALKQSPHVDSNRVKLLEALWRTVLTLKRNADNPPTTYQGYSQVAIQQSDNLKRQVTQLADSFSQLRPAYAD